jgi:hypothetical protein
MSRRYLIPVLSSLVVAVSAVAALGLSSGAAASSGPQVRIRDDCDPATFNAAVGPGTCVGTGKTTFAAFLAELAQTHQVKAWRFDDNRTDIHAGETLTVVNRGGETHTFTRVQQFGGGFVPLLNQLANTPTPAPECLGAPATLNFVPAGGTFSVVAGSSGLPLPTTPGGTDLFQCCIHPWMHEVVTVERN